MAEKNFFKNLFRHKAEQAPEEAPPVKEPAPAPAPPVVEKPEGKLSEVKGSLLDVWKKWAGDFAAPPTLYLAKNVPDGRFCLDHQQLERETVRLAVQLEQEAKRRMKDIKTMEEQNAADRARVEQAVKDALERGEEPPEQEELEERFLNAHCRVYLSKDRMMAWLFVFPPVGEKGELQADAIGNELQENGVTAGVEMGAVLKTLQSKAFFELIPIAFGTPAVEGKDGSVIEFFPREIPDEVKIDELGEADYKCTSYVRQITKGEAICHINFPVPGEPGLRVDGTVVEPKPVKKAKVPKGSNTELTEDGTRLIASMDGHLEFVSDAFQVRPVLEVKGDVDYEVGNINFIGDVKIHGDVRENFTVTATGTVTVSGLVEAATVEAGGDLIITRGVVGDHRALLRSGGSVRCKYLENCVVYAGKGVFADCIMHSQIFSDTDVVVTTGRGSIIGGSVTAARMIKARMIGAESGRRTDLTLGVLPFVQNELHNIRTDMEANHKEQVELEKTLAFLERTQGMTGGDPRLAKGRMRRSVLEMKARQLHKREKELEPMSVDLNKCRLECDTIYPVTELTVHHYTWSTRDVRHHVKMKYEESFGQMVDAF